MYFKGLLSISREEYKYRGTRGCHEITQIYDMDICADVHEHVLIQ